jgi:HSP20 family molecular chaperone IbpA
VEIIVQLQNLNGVLEIKLPKKEESVGKKIPIES